MPRPRIRETMTSTKLMKKLRSEGVPKTKKGERNKRLASDLVPDPIGLTGTFRQSCSEQL